MPTSFGLEKCLTQHRSQGRHALLAQLEAPHFDEVLGYFRDALLAFVDRKVRPVDEFVVDLG
jgi:hypothetical protein